MYEEYALAGKVYEYLIADINPEISDDGAKGLSLCRIFLIKTYSLNGNGESSLQYTGRSGEAYQRAQEGRAAVPGAGEDFSSLK